MGHKSLIYVLLMGSLFLTSCGQSSSSSSLSEESSEPASSSDTSSSSPSPVIAGTKVGDVLDLLQDNAVKYNSYITENALLKKAGLTTSDLLNNTSAYRLLYAAFKDSLPERIGARNYEGTLISAVNNVPEAAKEAVDFFLDRGLYSPVVEYDPEFHPDAEVTPSYFWTLLDRIHCYFGTSVNDDYYSYINHNELFNNASRSSWRPASSYSYGNVGSLSFLKEWCTSFLNDSDLDEAHLTTARAFYSTYTDQTTRDDKSKGIYPVFQSIMACSDETSLMNLVASLSKSQGFDPLFEQQKVVEVVEDDHQTSMALSVGPMNISSYYAIPPAPGSLARAGLIGEKKQEFLELGFSNSDSATYAEALTDLIYQMVLESQKLAGVKYPTYLPITSSSTFSSWNLYDHLVSAGFSFVASSSKYSSAVLPYPGYASGGFNALFGSASTLIMKKAYVLQMEANHYIQALPYDAMVHFSHLSGGVEEMTSDSFFYLYAMPALSDSLSDYFATTTTYKSCLAIANSTVENLMTTFQERVDASSWLSAEGKTASKKKIASMRRCSFGSLSDGSSIPSSTPAYVSASNGGTLYENLVQYDLSYFAKNLAYYGKQENLESVSAMFPALTPNAFYIVDDNSFTLQLGYLASSAASFQDMSANTLAGTLGWVAGHEICHGFDSNGTNFDATGHYNLTWWNSADHTAFEGIASKVSAFYEGYQQFPSFGMSGQLVLAEALADIGGLALTYDALKKNSAFDAKAFFKAGAENFFMVTSHDLFASFYAKDVHPYGRGRVNRAFSSFGPFHETLGTTSKDFMYVSPEKRITLW